MARPQDEFGQPIKYDPDFKGPLRKRSCTDIICLLLFVVFIACWIGIGIYALKNGDPETLLVPKDSSGARCGLDPHVKDLPYLFFFNLLECLNPNVPFTGCPTKQVCVKECPKDYFFWKNNPNEYNKLICEYNSGVGPSNANNYVETKKCAQWYLPSTSFEKRCIPIINSTLFDEHAEEIGASLQSITSAINNIKILSQAEQIGQNVVDDIISSWWRILIGIAIAVVTCIIYILIMRWIAAVMVWLSLFGVLILLGAATALTTKRYIDLKNNPVDDSEEGNIFQSYLTKKDTWLVLAIISAAFLLLVLLILIFLRKRILLAIALVKEGSRAVSYVTSVLFFPIFPWVLQIGVMAFAICVGLYLSTTGDPLYKIRNMDGSCTCVGGIAYKNGTECTPTTFLEQCTATSCASASCKFVGMQNPPIYPYLQAYNVVAFLWGAFFVSALGQMVLASVFATWYWTWKKSNLPFFAVTEASARVLRYHIGTLAFGSLIITICRLIRICLEYVDQKLKKYDNEITKAILCCCKCFFWCLEKFLKFINKNAYIMCAIHGKNFCLSAKDAFSLLMRNIIRVFVLDKVTDFLFFLGKLLITIGVGGISYLIFATDLTSIDNSGLNYEYVPTIIIMICTYLIASIFFSVYSMAVDTLFLCFLEDCERNDGSAEKPYYMSRNLMKIFGKKNKQH